MDMSDPQTPEQTTPPPPKFSKDWWKLMWREQIRPLIVLLACLFSVGAAPAE